MSSTEDTEKNKSWYNSHPTFMVVTPVVIVILILGTIRLFTPHNSTGKTFFRENYPNFGISNEDAGRGWRHLLLIKPDPEAGAEPEAGSNEIVMSGGFDVLSTIGGNTKGNIKVLVMVVKVVKKLRYY